MQDLLPERYPNQDFFIADILDAAPKSDMGSMEHPIFSLSKKPDFTTRQYEHKDTSTEVQPSTKGIANIWDKDVLIYCCSQLREGINRGIKPSPIIQIRAHDLLVATNKKVIGGGDYKQLLSSLERLAGTRIKTNIKTGDSADKYNFGLVVQYRVLEEKIAGKDQMTSIAIEIPNWLYRAVVSGEVLTLDRDYFRLRGGVERRLYELARKHCGNQSKWVIGLPLLHKKSGSQSPLKAFKHKLMMLIKTDHLPGYSMTYRIDKDQITFYNRKGNKAAKAHFDDKMKELFAPSSRKRKARKHSGAPETQFNLGLK